MGRNVAVVAVGQTRYGNRTELSYPELVREAVIACLADAGIERDEVDAVASGSMPPFMEGTDSLEFWLIDGMGMAGKPLMRTATCGSTGMSVAHTAYYHVASGVYDLVMAIGFEKMHENDPQGTMMNVGDPFYQRIVLAGAPGGIALQSREYIFSCPVPEERIRLAAARLSVRNHLAGLQNPYAHIQQEITVDDVLRSRVICDPLHLLDICPASDGACAILFASEEKAKRIATNPAWVTGVAYVGDEWILPDKDLGRWECPRLAAERAYKMAGIKDPLRDLDVAEVYNPFTFQEMIFYEAFGFCDPGHACELIESGATDPGGELPCDPSGGVLCTNPIGATALIRVAEAALQVMGRAGPHQIPKVNRALSHGWGGDIQFNGIMILSRTL